MLCFPRSFLRSLIYTAVVTANFVSLLSFIDADIAFGETLEPAFENLLRHINVHVTIDAPPRIQNGGYKMADGRAGSSHGIPVTMLRCDWTSVMTEFKAKYGKHMTELPVTAQSCYVAFASALSALNLFQS